jgi:hypothetical protein
MADKRPREAAFKETNDLAFAAFAHMMGLKVQKAKKWNRGQAIEYKFVFADPPTGQDPEGRWDALLLDFANSQALKFDGSVRTLKRLCNARP